MQKIISAKYIFDGSRLHQNCALQIDNNKVVGVVHLDNSDNLDYPNSVLSVAFTDLQINGCGGVIFNDDVSHKTLEIMHQANLRSGTHRFLPTLITDDLAKMPLALDSVDTWITLYGLERGVVGIHLEGPFISKEKSGIHPKEYVVQISKENAQLIASYASKFSIILTVAAENIEAEIVQYLTDAGVIVMIGHSNATYEQAVDIANAGAVGVTHLYNAMSGYSGRAPGVIGACFDKQLYAGIIVDLLHVDAASVRIASRLLADKLYLVTDAVAPAGCSMTEFDFAGKHLYVRDGRVVDGNGTLGGAYLTMTEAVLNCINKVGFSVEHTFRMAITVPNKLINKPVDIIGQSYADIIEIKL